MRHLITLLVATSAFVFNSAAAGADVGDQLHKLLPDYGAAEDYFGYAVSISGDVAIVGARLDDDNGNWSGAAYLFDTTTGQQLSKFLPDDNAAADQLGVSVAISGDIAIVGAYWDDDNGGNSGSAYGFDISVPTLPTQLFKLLPDDGAAADGFGASVAIRLAVAAGPLNPGRHRDRRAAGTKWRGPCEHH